MLGLGIGLGGNVVEGSIQWDKFRHRPTFLVAEGGKTLTVRYVGNNMVPDTFKDGSPVVLEGRYVVGEGVFAAEVIMAKCPSKYEGALTKEEVARREAEAAAGPARMPPGHGAVAYGPPPPPGGGRGLFF